MNQFKVNKIFLMGRAGADAKERSVGSDKKVCSLRIASDDGYYSTEKNEYISITNWHTIEGWGFAAEKIVKVQKGDLVFVNGGKLEYNSWENEKGEKRISAIIKIPNSSGLQIIPKEQDNTTHIPGEVGDNPFDNEDDSDGFPF